jgi:hypothetical protein
VDQLVEFVDELVLPVCSVLEQFLTELADLGLHYLGSEALDFPLHLP